MKINVGYNYLKLCIRALTSVVIVLSNVSFGELPVVEGHLQIPPKLRLRDNVYDFGDVWQDDELKCSFEIFNDGEGDLVIFDQSTTCGCTTAKPLDKIIPPKHKQDLDISFSTRNILGQTTKKVLLHTNDPVQPKTILAIMANVKPTIEVIPSKVNFGALSTGIPIRKIVTIKRKRGDGAIRIKEIHSSSKMIKAEIVEFSGNGCKLAITLSSCMAQEVSETLVISLEDKELSKARIPIEATIHGKYHVEPDRLFFGFIKPGQRVSKKIAGNKGVAPLLKT